MRRHLYSDLRCPEPSLRATIRGRNRGWSCCDGPNFWTHPIRLAALRRHRMAGPLEESPRQVITDHRVPGADGVWLKRPQGEPSTGLSGHEVKVVKSYQGGRSKSVHRSYDLRFYFMFR
jgi:hypothetical protein